MHVTQNYNQHLNMASNTGITSDMDLIKTEHKQNVNNTVTLEEGFFK